MLGTEGFWVQRLKEISSFPPSPSLHYREIPGTETQRIFLTVIPGTDTYSREIPLLFPLPSLPLGRSRVQRLREFSRIFPIRSLGTKSGYQGLLVQNTQNILSIRILSEENCKKKLKIFIDFVKFIHLEYF